MLTRLLRILGWTPSTEVRALRESHRRELKRTILEHNRQRRADDAVYRGQSAEIERLGRMLAERKTEVLEVELRRISEVAALKAEIAALQPSGTLPSSRGRLSLIAS